MTLRLFILLLTLATVVGLYGAVLTVGTLRFGPPGTTSNYIVTDQNEKLITDTGDYLIWQ
jgi:hypothetical protein